MSFNELKLDHPITKEILQEVITTQKVKFFRDGPWEPTTFCGCEAIERVDLILGDSYGRKIAFFLDNTIYILGSSEKGKEMTDPAVMKMYESCRRVPAKP